MEVADTGREKIRRIFLVKLSIYFKNLGCDVVSIFKCIICILYLETNNKYLIVLCLLWFIALTKYCSIPDLHFRHLLIDISSSNILIFGNFIGS